MLSQKFWINYRSFTSVVLCTQTLHQQWLHTRACYKNHRPATIMVISLSLRFVDQIGTSVRFWPKKSEMLKLWRRLWAKWLHWQSCLLGGSYLFMKYDVFIQIAEFFLGIELISFNTYILAVHYTRVRILNLLKQIHRFSLLKKIQEFRCICRTK